MPDSGETNPIAEVLRLLHQQTDTLKVSKVSSEEAWEYRQRSMQIRMLLEKLAKQGIGLTIWGHGRLESVAPGSD